MSVILGKLLFIFYIPEKGPFPVLYARMLSFPLIVQLILLQLFH